MSPIWKNNVITAYYAEMKKTVSTLPKVLKYSIKTGKWSVASYGALMLFKKAKFVWARRGQPKQNSRQSPISYLPYG